MINNNGLLNQSHLRNKNQLNRIGLLAACVAIALLAISTSFDSTTPKASAATPEGATSIPKAVTISDDFNNGQMSGWKKVDNGNQSGPSNWAVREGKLVQSSNIWSGDRGVASLDKEGTYSIIGKWDWRDYEYEVKVLSTDNDAIGMMFRYKDDNNYYRFSIDQERGLRRLVKKVNGVYTLLAESRVGYTSNQWYNLNASAVGSTIKISVNGSQVFSVQDSSLPTGKVGLYSWGNQSSYFDNVRIDVSVDSYSVVVLPDTQYYTKNYPAIFTSQTQWIADNRAKQNIAFVLHEGDITDGNSTQEWINAKTSMRYLDGKVPYVLVAGNHDSSTNGLGDYNVFNQIFPVGKFSHDQGGIVESYPSGTMNNSAHLYSAGGNDWLIIGLEFGPNDNTLAWANGVAARYPNRKVIMLTHTYLFADDTLHGSKSGHGSLPIRPGSNNGVGMWNKFVKKPANMQFTFNGHVLRDGVGRLVSQGDNGNNVYQMLANYQKNAEGGGGYLRIVTFYPSQDRVEVKTYSPYRLRYLTDSGNQFEFTNVNL